MPSSSPSEHTPTISCSPWRQDIGLRRFLCASIFAISWNWPPPTLSQASPRCPQCSLPHANFRAVILAWIIPVRARYAPRPGNPKVPYPPGIWRPMAHLSLASHAGTDPPHRRHRPDHPHTDRLLYSRPQKLPASSEFLTRWLDGVRSGTLASAHVHPLAPAPHLDLVWNALLPIYVVAAASCPRPATLPPRRGPVGIPSLHFGKPTETPPVLPSSSPLPSSRNKRSTRYSPDGPIIPTSHRIANADFISLVGQPAPHHGMAEALHFTTNVTRQLVAVTSFPVETSGIGWLKLTTNSSTRHASGPSC